MAYGVQGGSGHVSARTRCGSRATGKCGGQGREIRTGIASAKLRVALGCEPPAEIRLLELAELNTAVDRIHGMRQPDARGRHLVFGEKLPHVVPCFRRAETAGALHQTA